MKSVDLMGTSVADGGCVENGGSITGVSGERRRCVGGLCAGLGVTVVCREVL